MAFTPRPRTPHFLRSVLLRPGMVFAGLLAALLVAPAANAQDAAGLRARHTALRDALANSLFQRPLVLESAQTDGSLKGDVYAVVAQPYNVVGPALQASEHWCGIA